MDPWSASVAATVQWPSQSSGSRNARLPLQRACVSLVPAGIASLDCSVRDRRAAQGRLGFLQEWQEVAMQAFAKGAWVGGRIFVVCVVGAIVAGVFAAGLGTIAAVLGIFLAS